MRRAFVIVALLAATPARAETPERLQSDLEQGTRLFRRNPEPGAAAAYARRLSYVEVEWNGETIAVRDPWLTDAVDSLESLSEKDRRTRLDAIAAHLAARAAMVDAGGVEGAPRAAATPAPPEDPERVLEGILDQQQFRRPVEDPKLARAAAKLRDRVRAAWTAVKEFVRELLRLDPQDEGTWGLVKQILTLVLAVAAVAVVAWLVGRALLRAASDAEPAVPDEDAMPEAPPVPAKMIAEADRLSDAGDLRGAVRAHYLALLGRLHRDGALVYDRHRTNREYLRTMRASPARVAAFAEAVEVFDRKWYGKEPCTREEVASFADACRRAATIQEAA